MRKGLAEEGTIINCRECRYGSECNTANAHGYKVGFCSQYIKKAKAQTNADRIRSMTDEELAEWFGISESMCPDGFSETNDCDACPEVCTGHWLQWLKEEVKE